MAITATTFKAVSGQFYRAARKQTAAIKNLAFDDLRYIPVTSKTPTANPIRSEIADALKKRADTLSKDERKVFWQYVKQDRVLKAKSTEDLHSKVDLYTNISRYKANHVEQRLQEAMQNGAIPFEMKNITYSKKDFKRILSYQLDNTYADALRSGRALTAQETKGVNHLKRIIDKSKPLEKDMTVFRTINDTFGFSKQLKEGAIIKDKAFLSTSMKWDSLQKMWNVPDETKTYRLRIYLKKGTKGIDCNGTYKPLFGKLKSTGIKNEFILPPDSELLVKKIDKDLDIIDMEYLLPQKT